MKQPIYKYVELFLIFIVVPLCFAIDFPIWIKLVIGGFGFIYIIFVLLKIEAKKFKIAKHLNWRQFWKRTSYQLIGIALVTILYVFIFDYKNLFIMPLNKTIVWIIFLFVYSFFSVYPQELIYRTFYFQRYQNLFKDEKLFIFLNAIVFSLAHIFFKSTMVLVIAFIGGLLFAVTYNRTKSTLLVTIEHAIYGSWLFTVGMGEMLGFPT